MWPYIASRNAVNYQPLSCPEEKLGVGWAKYAWHINQREYSMKKNQTTIEKKIVNEMDRNRD